MATETEKALYGLMTVAEETTTIAQSTIREFEEKAKEIQISLDKHLRTLPATTREAISGTVREILISEAKQASAELLIAASKAKESGNFLQQKGFLLSVLIVSVTILCIFFGVGLMKWTISKLEKEENNIRNEIVRLKNTADEFARKAGKADLNTCDGRLCIRVDKKAGEFESNEKETFMVIYGY